MKANRFWRDRDITDRLQREREWRKHDDRPAIGFKFEERNDDH